MLGILHAEPSPWTRMNSNHTGSLHMPAQRKARVNGKPGHHSLNRHISHSRLEESLDAVPPPGLPTVASLLPSPAAGDASDSVIEVQVLPQQAWADTAAAITSDGSGSVDDLGRLPRHPERSLGFQCRRFWTAAATGLVCALGFLSPVAMVVLPRTRLLGLKKPQLHCGAECDGTLVGFTFKLLLLALAAWAVFFRQSRATLPRIHTFRAVLLFLVFTFTLSFWLFFFVRVLEERAELRYYTIVLFAGSLVDVLLWLHYLAVLLLELRQLQPQFAVRVVRSPDGEARLFPLGNLSIQRAAVELLQRYYTEFPVYNPYLERLPASRNSRKASSVTSYKFYDVDGSAAGSVVQSPGRRRDSSHNERFYEEHEYERRVRKRRARLTAAADEAFTHIRRLTEQRGAAIPMDPHEAAQAIFPTMARPLQKFLRITRQQPRHTVDSILAHLAQCLAHDLAPRAFLARYVSAAPVLQAGPRRRLQSWALVSAAPLSRPLAEGAVFQLRQDDVSLLCSVLALPHLNLSEQMIDPKCNKFVLRLNSETSV